MFFSLFIGVTDDGFEMLEQLAYLYLANNKVSLFFGGVIRQF